jgi:hypothetical protein
MKTLLSENRNETKLDLDRIGEFSKRIMNFIRDGDQNDQESLALVKTNVENDSKCTCPPGQDKVLGYGISDFYFPKQKSRGFVFSGQVSTSGELNSTNTNCDNEESWRALFTSFRESLRADMNLVTSDFVEIEKAVKVVEQ